MTAKASTTPMTSLRGACPLVADGEPTGLYVRFSFGARALMQDKLGDSYALRIDEAVSAHDVVTMRSVLEITTFYEDGEAVPPEYWDDPDVLLVEAGPVLRDALFIQTHGKIYSEVLADYERQLADAKARNAEDQDEPDPTPRTGSSAASSSPSSEVSAPASSTL